MSDLYEQVFEHGGRIAGNLKQTLTDLSLEKWIRLVVIVGAYMLLRPYLMKLGSRIQMSRHEKESAEAEAEAARLGKVSPNAVRGLAEVVPDDTDDEDDVGGVGGGASSAASGGATGADWGKKARQRQRRVVRKILEAEEQRLREQQEDEEDKDIEEFLVE